MTSATYTKGCVVVYKSHGVGTVLGITRTEAAGIEVECYEIELHVSRNIVKVPTRKADTLHPISDASVIPKIVNTLLSTPQTLARGWNVLRSNGSNELREKINSGDLPTIAEVFRDLNGQSSYTAMSWRDEALAMIIAEVSVIRNDANYQETLAFLAKKTGLQLVMPTVLQRTEESAADHVPSMVVTEPLRRKPREGYLAAECVPSSEDVPFQEPPAPHTPPPVQEGTVVRAPVATRKPKKDRVSRPATPKESPKEKEPEKVFKGIVRRPDGTWGPVYE